MASLLQIDDLHTEIRLRSATVHALDGVGLSVEAGECLGIVGESGSGKTMTALSVMQLLPPGGHITGGRILLDGTVISTLDDEAMRHVRGNEIGMIFQDPMTSLNPTMTIGDQIAETVRLHRGADKQAAGDRAVEVLGLVGMPRPGERVRAYPHQLSGGMRQRVMIAMALAAEPRLLIADEPTTALDVTIQKQILELIDDLRKRLGMAVILVTHDLGVIAGRADRAVVMYAGRVMEDTSTLRLFGNPRHPYTEALFQALPEKAAGASGRLYNIPGQPPDPTRPPAGCKFAARCRYVQDKCRQAEPALEGGGWDHRYRCFFPVGSPTGDAGTAALAGAEPGPGSAERAARTAAGDGGPLLSIDHLVKNFTVTSGALLQRKIGEVSAVADVSFQVQPGQTFGMVGESGCGKTTIGRVIVALERPNSGSVKLQGKDVSAMSGGQLRRFRRDLQLVFQDPYSSLDPRMRVGAIIGEPLAIQGMGSHADQQRRVYELLDEVGLPRHAVERYPHEFSGGQRQRIGLARALTLNPQVIVADEPVSALDVSIRAQVLNLMKRLQADHGLTYIVISHDLAVVKYMADRIGVMYLGKLVEMGSGADIYERAAHPYSDALIKTIPAPDPVVARKHAEVAISGELPSPINPPSGCRFRTRCPYAQDLCEHEEPHLRVFGPGHVAACHFPLQTYSPAKLGEEPEQ
ncbi:MAG: dipeptide ABC transporter ATP-binding protein [Streptosporangiaceae bacterium]